MPRRIRVREAGEEPRAGGADERRQWLSQWKKRAIEQLPTDTPRPLKVQLRADVDRALGHFRPGDDEEEVRDVVESAVDDTLKRLATMAADQHHQVSKKTLLVLAPVFLNIALSNHQPMSPPTLEAAAHLPKVNISWLYARSPTNAMSHIKRAKCLRCDQDELLTWVRPFRRGGRG